ncbi:MAG TPA: GDSL-type esterase/lipase family protein [Polyangiaceae bacterium]|nr:GDSL-type esterase/lipase family protein [Polyangiaceae bacterium]
MQTSSDSERDAHRVHEAPRHTLRALLVMTVVLAVPYATPRLRALRVVELPHGEPPGEEALGASEGERVSASAAPTSPPGEQALPASENMATVNNALPPESLEPRGALPPITREVRASLRSVAIEDPSGHALDKFFERLARTDRKEQGAVTRVLHYGDSIIASDYVSGTARRRLQARFGDAGHGFILIANPWQWYFHNDVAHTSNSEWKASRLRGPAAADGMYGLGGVSFTSYAGGVAWFGTATHGDFGRRVSRFDLYYLEQPGGGTLEMSVRGGAQERFSTRGDTKVARVHSIRTEDGEAGMTVRATGGPVRLFGVALERDRPGVVYDALGSHGALAMLWQRQNREHWKEEMALRDPALVIVEYGTNESDLWRLDRTEYEHTLSDLIDELHEVAPRASVLVISPLDRGEVRAGKIVTKPVIVDLVTIQRRVAAARGAAFWSAFDAMGGQGAMARWVRARPQLAGEDLTHPTPVGAEVLGDMLSDAIIDGFVHNSRAEAPTYSETP